MGVTITPTNRDSVAAGLVEVSREVEAKLFGRRVFTYRVFINRTLVQRSLWVPALHRHWCRTRAR